jgi:hypothetical protein
VWQSNHSVLMINCDIGCSTAQMASRGLSLYTNHHQEVSLSVSNIVTIGLDPSLEPRYPFERNSTQGRVFKRSQDHRNRRTKILPVSNDSPLIRLFTWANR